MTRPVGQHLRLQQYGGRIRWCGVRGMKWHNLKENLEKYLQHLPPPSYLVIQLGSNDLTCGDSGSLRWHMKRDLEYISQLLPNTRLVWSCILPRLYWHGARSHVAINKTRKRVNREISNLVLSLGGRVIKQADISEQDSGSFQI
jgi:hypothetical protein